MSAPDYHRDVADKAIAAVQVKGAKYLPAVMQFTLADAAWLHEQGRPDMAGEVLAAWAQASMTDTSAEAAGVTLPCDRTAVALRLDEEGHAYPVCRAHVRHPLVSLVDTVAAVRAQIAADISELKRDRHPTPARTAFEMAARTAQGGVS